MNKSKWHFYVSVSGSKTIIMWLRQMKVEKSALAQCHKMQTRANGDPQATCGTCHGDMFTARIGLPNSQTHSPWNVFSIVEIHQLKSKFIDSVVVLLRYLCISANFHNKTMFKWLVRLFGPIQVFHMAICKQKLPTPGVMPCLYIFAYFVIYCFAEDSNKLYVSNFCYLPQMVVYVKKASGRDSICWHHLFMCNMWLVCRTVTFRLADDRCNWHDTKRYSATCPRIVFI